MDNRGTALSNAGRSLSHNFADQFSAERLERQQLHHKKLLRKRLLEKKRGSSEDSDAGPSSSADHPENVRAREQKRKERIAKQRLDLKRREQHQKAQLRAQQRRNHEDFVIVAKDGHLQQELTKEERRHRLKLRQELERQRREERRERDYNPFDPNSKPVHQGDIWDDDDADAMFASAGMHLMLCWRYVSFDYPSTGGSIDDMT